MGVIRLELLHICTLSLRVKQVSTSKRAVRTLKYKRFVAMEADPEIIKAFAACATKKEVSNSFTNFFFVVGTTRPAFPETLKYCSGDPRPPAPPGFVYELHDEIRPLYLFLCILFFPEGKSVS